MNKLAQLIKELDYKDLILLKKDYDQGHIEKLLEKNIETKRKEHITLCPVCSTPVQQGKGYYLEYGELRKKATFDAKDCLVYFLTRK
jgi:hypothetical protein